MVGAILFAQFCVGNYIFNAILNSVNIGMVLGFLLCSLTIIFTWKKHFCIKVEHAMDANTRLFCFCFIIYHRMCRRKFCLGRVPKNYEKNPKRKRRPVGRPKKFIQPASSGLSSSCPPSPTHSSSPNDVCLKTLTKDLVLPSKQWVIQIQNADSVGICMFPTGCHGSHPFPCGDTWSVMDSYHSWERGRPIDVLCAVRHP